MEARKLLYTSMVAAPAIFLAGIGIHARTFVDPFQFTDTTNDQARMNAYLGIVRESHDKLGYLRKADRQDVRDVAAKWIEGYHSGRLQPLVPVAYDEMVPTGAKDQIVDALSSTYRHLTRQADEEIEEGKNDIAAQDLATSIKLVQTVKFSSFAIDFRCSIWQKSALKRIGEIYSKLSPATKASIEKVLDELANENDREELLRISSNAKHIYFEAMHRQEEAETAMLSAEKVVPSRSFFELPALAKERVLAQNGMGGQDLITDMFVLPNLMSDAARCMNQEDELKAQVQKLLNGG